MVESSEILQGGKGQTDIVLEDLATRTMKVLNRCRKHTPNNDSSMVQIGIKLDDTNYAHWSQVIEIYVLSKGKLGYINDELSQPSLKDSIYRQWQIRDSIIKGWLINNMASSLIGNFITLSYCQSDMGCYYHNTL